MSSLRHCIPNWAIIDPLTISDHPEIIGNVAHFQTNKGLLRINFIDGAMRLRMGKETGRDYGILTQDPLPNSCEIIRNKNNSTLISGTAKFIVHHHPFHFEYFVDDILIQRSPTDGHFARPHRLPPLAKVDDGWMIGLTLNDGEPVYGLGEKWGRLNKRGQLIHSYNHDALGVNAEASYKNSPFAWCQGTYKGQPRAWGLFIHTPSPVLHSAGFPQWSNRSYHAVVEDGPLDLFLFHGETGQDMIRIYCDLTGYANCPPEWSHGNILSRAYYKDGKDILAAAHKVREKNMPCDVITFDGRAWQDTKTRFHFGFDPARYPEPLKILDELKALNFKICVWEYPLISIHSPLHKELARKGWLIKHKNGTAYDYHWSPEPFGDILSLLPPSGIIDFTHPDAYDWWKHQHKSLFEMGIDMIKADFGEQITDDMHAYNGANGQELHNVYALLYNQCVYDAAKQYAPSGAFLFSRAGWTGSQKYPSLWGGDPQADWDGLAASIRGGLSWGLTGGPFYATDIGGFYGDTRDEALYVRWLQVGIFAAHLRFHGIGEREPWSYGPNAEAAAMDMLDLRQKLLPEIRTAAEQASTTGLPVNRAMPLAFPDDRAAWTYDTQFMLGDDILVIPCTRADGHIHGYLPQLSDGQTWQHIITSKTYQPGTIFTTDLALNELAVFKIS